MEPEQLARFKAAAQEVASFSANLPGLLEDLQRKEAEARWVLPAESLRCVAATRSAAHAARRLAASAHHLAFCFTTPALQAAGGGAAGGEG